ncbi:hypothetical protein BaRGS_00032348 [Batillaria attramentaria]|uniref:Uncharacterized protein n=1 Tax=Batillaria attramentaria TaxID=370345 RepID=A0ABD0JMZ5_9CAEN
MRSRPDSEKGGGGKKGEERNNESKIRNNLQVKREIPQNNDSPFSPNSCITIRVSRIRKCTHFRTKTEFTTADEWVDTSYRRCTQFADIESLGWLNLTENQKRIKRDHGAVDSRCRSHTTSLRLVLCILVTCSPHLSVNASTSSFTTLAPNKSTGGQTTESWNLQSSPVTHRHSVKAGSSFLSSVIATDSTTGFQTDESSDHPSSTFPPNAVVTTPHSHGSSNTTCRTAVF